MSKDGANKFLACRMRSLNLFPKAGKSTRTVCFPAKNPTHSGNSVFFHNEKINIPKANQKFNIPRMVYDVCIQAVQVSHTKQIDFKKGRAVVAELMSEGGKKKGEKEE